MAKQCPVCGLFNPDAAERCDCGFNFAQRQLRSEELDPQSRRAIHKEIIARADTAHRSMLFGLAWCVGGLALSALTYTLSSQGDRYIFAVAPIVCGGIKFYRAMRARDRWLSDAQVW